MIVLNMTAIISNGEVVSYDIGPDFTHDASVKDKREFYNLKNVLKYRMERFVKRTRSGHGGMHRKGEDNGGCNHV